jgi:multidrug efflux pump
LQINQFADKQVKNRLQTLAGVADIRIFGERKPAMRIWLNAEKLARI